MRRSSSKFYPGKLRGGRGFNLIELTVTLAFSSIALPALAYLFGVGVREDSHNSSVAQAYFLATGLMSEISKRRFRESVADPGNGVEAAEENGFDRRGFDDIDDYQIFSTKWNAIAPRDEAGNPLSDYGQFKELVEVYNIANVPAGPATRSFAAVQAGTTEFKVVKVIVSWDNGTRSIVTSKVFAYR